MKKSICVILLIFLAIIIGIYAKYRQNLKSQYEAKRFNEQYEFFNKETVLGTDVTTIINKAIDNNENYLIEKDNDGFYIVDDKYSIKIYIYMIINEKTYAMEELVKKSLTDFTKNFGEIKFQCTDVKYHKATGRVAEMTFASTEY